MTNTFNPLTTILIALVVVLLGVVGYLVTNKSESTSESGAAVLDTSEPEATSTSGTTDEDKTTTEIIDEMDNNQTPTNSEAATDTGVSDDAGQDAARVATRDSFSSDEFAIMFKDQYGNPMSRFLWPVTIYSETGGEIGSLRYPVYFDAGWEEQVYIFAAHPSYRIDPGTYIVRWSDGGNEVSSENDAGTTHGGSWKWYRGIHGGEATITVPSTGNKGIVLDMKTEGIAYGYIEDMITLNLFTGDISKPLPQSIKYTSNYDFGRNYGQLAGYIQPIDRGAGLYSVHTGRPVPPGDYEITVEAPGFESITIPLSLSDYSDWSDGELDAKNPIEQHLGSFTLEPVASN